MQGLKQTNLLGLKLLARGKVRDIYDLGDSLLIVATDRVSAFDVVMEEPIPEKGKILTQISSFWFQATEDIIPNHLISTDVRNFPAQCASHKELLEGRSMWVHKAEPLPVECIVRGYLAGSGWKDYQKTGAVCGQILPKGMVESQCLPEPLFTPSTKAEGGAHDQNISFKEAEQILGEDLAARVREVSLAIYERGRQIAEAKGIIVADTKFEFGLLDGKLILIDEVLTPDSSRFWPMDGYKPGGPQPSFDKQYLRDYLDSLGWDHTPPPPPLPPHVVEHTREKYLEALFKLTGRGLS